MKLTYIYHSGFILENEACTIIIDYYRDTSDGCVHKLVSGQEKPCYILSTHAHADHFNPEILQWKKEHPDFRYILSEDILEAKLAGETDAVFLDKLETYQDDILKITAFGSTDIGVSFLIETDRKKIFHAGDLNNWHWNEESTEEESAGYEKNFLAELELLANATTELDLVMFPVDPRLGKDYMRGARQFIDRIKTNIFVPMHFWGKFGKAAAFKPYAEQKGCKFIALSHEGETIIL